MKNASATMGVYRITCQPTGDTYIGASVNVAKRLKAHRGELRRGMHPNRRLQKLWHQYGSEQFADEIVEHVALFADLAGAERRWAEAEPRAISSVCKAGQSLRLPREPRKRHVISIRATEQEKDSYRQLAEDEGKSLTKIIKDYLSRLLHRKK